MERTILFSLMIISSTLANAQWQWQNPTPTGNPLQKIFFTDMDHGYISGYQGTILKTTDASQNWTLCETGVEFHLNELYFRNPDEGLAVGEGGVIIRTMNGGESWTTVQTGLSHVYGLEFQSDHLWLLADSGKILHSADFGLSWEVVYNNPSLSLDAISFGSINQGYVVGYNHSTLPGGFILKTIDNGVSWAYDTLSMVEHSDYNIDIQFFNQTGFLATSWGRLYKTIDGGASWTLNNEGADLTKMFFVDENHGWLHCVTYDTYPIFEEYSTSDGGITWDTCVYHWGITNNQFEILYLSSQQGYRLINGNSNHFPPKLLRTEDAGNNWDICFEVISNSSGSIYGQNFSSLVMTDDMTGYALAFPTSAVIGVYKTINGGQDWTYINGMIMGSYYPRGDLFFVNENLGWIVGYKRQSSVDSARAFRTVDGAENWTEVSPTLQRRLFAVHFVNETIGFITGNAGLILRSNDGGISWIEQASTTGADLNDVMFVNENNGWVCGNNGTILYTSDGGATWIQQQTNVSNNLNAVYFKNEFHGVAAGGGIILNTFDGGLNWSTGFSQGNITLSAIAMTDSLKAIAVGQNSQLYNGIILTSDDGGNNWTIPSQPCYNRLSCISSPQPGKIWIGGRRSTILFYDAASPSSVEELNWNQFGSFNLSIFPNPFTDDLRIKLKVDQTCRVNINVLNSMGQLVAVIEEKQLSEGVHHFSWNASGKPSGMYFLHMKIGDEVVTRRVVKH